jgi:hypothetical protein
MVVAEYAICLSWPRTMAASMAPNMADYKAEGHHHDEGALKIVKFQVYRECLYLTSCQPLYQSSGATDAS